MKSKFNEDLVMDMLIDQENGMNYIEISEKYNMSYSTVRRHINKLKKMLESNEESDNTNNLEINPKEIETNDTSMQYEGLKLFCSKNNILVCGLVADRHNMPTGLFIFDSIDSDLMFDYYM